jgi:hypothetical protein
MFNFSKLENITAPTWAAGQVGNAELVRWVSVRFDNYSNKLLPQLSITSATCRQSLPPES